MTDNDIFGIALADFYEQNNPAILWLYNQYGEPEEMPVDVFFRGEDAMPQLELLALSHCRGQILDIGAGAGSHALLLQRRGHEITALERSAIACRIMEDRGVKKVINRSIFDYQNEKYDTLLMLMNGIGLTKSIAGLRQFLQQAKTLLNPGGQLLFDSSDISYLYQEVALPPDKYFGEISYQYQYKSMQGEWFDWLYIDQRKLCQIAKEGGWEIKILYEDEMDQYLARLLPIS